MNYDENGKYYVKLHGHRELEELCQLVAFDAGVCWRSGGRNVNGDSIDQNKDRATFSYNFYYEKELCHGDDFGNKYLTCIELTVPEWLGFFKWLKQRKADKGEGWTKDSVMKKFDKFIEELRNM